MANYPSNQLVTTAPLTPINIAKEACIYGIPLILMNITKEQTINPKSGSASINQFTNQSCFLTAANQQVVRPNCDTYYSSAFLDLSGGPLVLNVPVTDEHYYLLPMLDAYTNINSESPGTRNQDTSGGQYLLVGSVPPPTDLDTSVYQKVIQCTTDMEWIIGRFRVDNPQEDGKIVTLLQKQLSITPLPTNEPLKDNTNLTNGDTRSPNTILEKMEVTTFFDQMNQLLALYPPPSNESYIMEQFASIGVGPNASPSFTDYYNSVSQAEQAELDSVITEVLAGLMKMASRSDHFSTNGWNVTAIPTMGRYGRHYVQRALIAYQGLGANLIEDSVYASIATDKFNHPLDGANTYEITFAADEQPPVETEAFWSLTVYDSNGYFVDNPIGRYAVGHSTEYPLKPNPNGSLTIVFKNIPSSGSTNPDDYSPNLLPIPTGSFNVLLRTYWPQKPILVSLDENAPDRWIPPFIIKV